MCKIFPSQNKCVGMFLVYTCHVPQQPSLAGPSSFRAVGICCPQQASCCWWSYNHRLCMQFIDLERLLSTASITSQISSRTSSHPPVFVPRGSAVHSRRHAVDGVITIDFACCLDSSSDPVIEPMLQSIPESFDPYGPPQVEDRIFSILQLLSINANASIQSFTENVKRAGGILSPLFIAQGGLVFDFECNLAQMKPVWKNAHSGESCDGLLCRIHTTGSWTWLKIWYLAFSHLVAQLFS